MSQNVERQRFFLRRNIVTLEPVAFLALFSSVLSDTASTSISLDKVCRFKLEIEKGICYDLQRQIRPNDEYDHMVFDYFILYTIWDNIISCVLPCLLLLFIGGWSDRTGRRKVILLLPVIGRSLQIVNSFINAGLLYQIPLEIHVFFNAFFVNAFGGPTLMCFALILYVVVTSTAQNRIYRLTSISVCSTTGVLFGLLFCRLIVVFAGYYPLLGLSLIMNTMTSLYIIYKVSDPKRTNEEMMYDQQTVTEFLKNFFNVAYVKETAEIISKKTRNKRELRLCIQMFSFAVIFSVSTGDVTILNSIARQNYGWNQLELQSYRISSTTLSTIGVLITVAVITKCLKRHDSVLGIISSIAKIMSSFVHCFINNHILYIGPLIDMFNGSSFLAMSSLISKLLETKESGKIFGLVFLLGNLVRLVYVPLYIIIHAMTKYYLPGAVYLVGAAYTLPVLFVYIWLLIDHRRDSVA